MEKFACLFILIFIGWLNVAAEELPQKAAQNPLDLAFFLTTKEKPSKHAEPLADALFETGRFDDALRALELDDGAYMQSIWIAYRAQILDERRNPVKAGEYLDKALAILKATNGSASSFTAAQLAGLLIKYNRDEDAVWLVEHTDNRNKALIRISHEFLKAQKTEQALKLLPLFSEDEEDEQDNLKPQFIELYARLKQTEKAEQMLTEFETTTISGESNYGNRLYVLLPFINANLALGRIDHAIELWEQYHEKHPDYGVQGWIKFIEALIEFEHREKADIYLTQIAADPEILKTRGQDVVRLYLRLGEVEKARQLSKTMSAGFDSYEQQSGLMLVADDFIAGAKTAAAAAVLDFALRRAARVVYAHEDLQSIGASSGSRKRIYLYNIYRRYMKIGQYAKALAAVKAIDSDHWIAKEFVMESLYDFLKTRAKLQPRSQTEKILKQMKDSIPGRDDDYDVAELKIFTADIYALLGEKTKATRLLAEAVTEGKEGCCYEFGFLLKAGQVFEKYQLKSDANLKKALRDFADPVDK